MAASVYDATPLRDFPLDKIHILKALINFINLEKLKPYTKDFQQMENDLIKLYKNSQREKMSEEKYNEYVEVFTNGTLITEEWANYFSENKIKIALSVYSYNSQIHDEVTQRKGSHQLTTKAIELLSKKNIQFR